MKWQYSYPANDAVHTETDTRFHITYGAGVQDVSITLVSSAKPLSDEEQARLIGELGQYVAQESLRNELRRLITTKCRNDLADAARALSLVTGKTVTTRTIQSWLIEPGRPSSRTCPEWAVSALREKETSTLRTNPIGSMPFHENPHAWAAEISNNKSVLLATEKIEQEEKRRMKWKKTSVSDLPTAIADMETQLWNWIHFLQDRQQAIHTALRNSSSFDDFKRTTLEMLEAKSSIDAAIHEARLEIEGDS